MQREYMSRVTKKTFILTTILTPIGFVIFWIALIFIMSSGVEDKKMALLDPDNLLQIEQMGMLRDDNVTYKYPKTTLEQLKQNFEEEGYDGIVYIPSQNFDSLTLNLNSHFYGNSDIGLNTQSSIKSAINQRARKIKMQAFNVDEATLDKLKTKIELTTNNLQKKDDKGISEARIGVASVLGGIMAFLIYIVIFIYGNMVMRSVMEEKTNRIVEVIISSVKPFQLMLGKIVGVGAVGLTQFAIWAIVFPLLYLGVAAMFSSELQALQEATNVSSAADNGMMDKIQLVISEMMTFNYSYILSLFLVYFLLGYVLYASLFAAVGAAMGDDWGEGQSLTLIVAIPVMVAFYIGIAVVQNPSSSLATWSSIVPLFSPIVMPARLVFEPPMWEVVTSVVVLFLTSIFFVWMSGRIYRIGILMYGKKVGLKEFATWMFRKN